MKTIFRFLNVAALTVAVLTVGAVTAFGQDACADVDGQTAAYTKFTDVYNKKDLPSMESALSAGKAFLEKYGACEPLKEQVDFVKPHVARIEKAIVRSKMVARYDTAVKADNPTEIVAAGKEFIVADPDNVNLLIPMALSATYKSTKDNNYQFANDGIQYANQALGKIKSGWVLNKKDDKGTPVIGVFQYTFTKENAIGELTYAIAYLNYYGKKDKKTALPLYYELSQTAGPFKSDPRVYGTIGDYYIEEGAPIGEEIAKLIADLKAATEDTVKADLDNKIKQKIALFNGYTERALDAYGRAHASAKPGPYKDNLYKVMQSLYKRRFEKDAGLDAFVATMIAKPFPNPTSPVTPVADPEPTTTTTGTPAGTSTTTNKPVSTNPAKASVAKKGTR